jgi:hypothetical protein
MLFPANVEALCNINNVIYRPRAKFGVWMELGETFRTFEYPPDWTFWARNVSAFKRHNTDIFHRTTVGSECGRIR